jgi:hypothetical protein
MDSQAIWTERVPEWKASGLTSLEYCEGKPFTAGGLRYWASRLRREQSRRPAPHAIRMARVIVGATASVPEPAPRQTPPISPGRSTTEALTVECGEMRVVVRPGFDRGTLAGVLDVLAARGGVR